VRHKNLIPGPEVVPGFSFEFESPEKSKALNTLILMVSPTEGPLYLFSFVRNSQLGPLLQTWIPSQEQKICHVPLCGTFTQDTTEALD
jgi:hypothetical protein